MKKKLYQNIKVLLQGNQTLLTMLFFMATQAKAQTTVTHVQQQANYCASFTAGTAGSFNQGSFQLGMFANGGTKQSVSWRNLTTNGSSCGSNQRSLQVGDQFVVTLSATRAYGRIGFALLASPTTGGSWANRESNYALSVNLDGPLYLGGSTYGNWYIRYNGGATAAASFGGQQTNYQNFTIAITLTAPDRANVSITNNNTSATSNFYDVLLNTANAITDYSVFFEDDYDGGTNRNMYWGLGASNQQHTVTDNRTISLGQSNGTFSISSVLPDGKAANLNSGSVANNLVKAGTGTITLTGANTYTGTTTVNGGTLVLNRSGGTTIPAGNNVTVNSGGTLKISSDQQLGTLTINSGGNLIVDPGVTVTAATITGNGTITVSATSGLVITGTGSTLNFNQASASSRSLNNLTLNSGTAASLGTALDVFGTIALTSASLDLNGQNLTLKSTATNTARIADLTGSTLTGATNVTMERYIKLRAGGTGRAYRLLTPTVNTAGSMRLNWMENGLNTAVGTNDDPKPLYGTQITGSGGNANGFDKTLSNASSLYLINNAATPTYTAIGNTSGTLNAKTGYFVYVRGDRSMDMTLPLDPFTNPTSSTTLRATGTLVQGTQTSFTNALLPGAGVKNIITNPYPSAIDWSLVYAASTDISDSYTFWDPNFGSRGGFVTVNTAGTASSGAGTQYIQSGQAFFVQSINGNTPTVSIQEGHKVANNNNGVFLIPPPPAESFRTELYFTEPNGFRRVADGAIAVYNNAYNAAVDAKDASEINNLDENIAIARDGKRLAIESRPVIGKSDDLPLFMNNMKERTYEFEFTPSVFTNTKLKAELIDNYLNTRTLLSVTEPTVVSFTVTADAASKATDRFKVVFGAVEGPQPDVITIKTKPGITVYPNPMPGNSFKMDLDNLAKGTYLLRLYDNTGVLVHTEQFLHDGSQASRTISLKTGMAKGVYQLQLSNANGFKTTKQIVRN